MGGEQTSATSDRHDHGCWSLAHDLVPHAFACLNLSTILSRSQGPTSANFLFPPPWQCGDDGTPLQTSWSVEQSKNEWRDRGETWWKNSTNCLCKIGILLYLLACHPVDIANQKNPPSFLRMFCPHCGSTETHRPIIPQILSPYVYIYILYTAKFLSHHWSELMATTHLRITNIMKRCWVQILSKAKLGALWSLLF